jgi:hypothetical protein
VDQGRSEGTFLAQRFAGRLSRRIGAGAPNDKSLMHHRHAVRTVDEQMGFKENALG